MIMVHMILRARASLLTHKYIFYLRRTAIYHTRTMSTATIAAIIDQVKIDILSKTQTVDNALKRKEISRTFICESESGRLVRHFLLNFFIQPILSQVELKPSNLSRNRISVQYAVPTEGMLAYASLATLGDDVYFEPSTAFVP